MNYLRDAARLDIIDLNYSFSSEQFEFRYTPAEARPRKGVVVRILVFLYRLLGSAFASRSGRSPLPTEPGSILFYARTKNQHDAILPVYKPLDHALIISWAGLEGSPFPIGRSYWIAVVFFPLVIIQFVKARGFVRESFRYIFDYYWLTYGIYVSTRMLLNKIAPSVVVMSNDHIVYNRTFTQAAKDAGVPTVYLQHAQIAGTLRYPVLAFDYALLDGEDALRKYDALGSTSSRVFLVGSPKHDEYYSHIKKKRTLQSLGLAANRFDPSGRIEELCMALSSHFPSYRIILRPHPAMWNQQNWSQFSKKYGVELSDPLQEHPYEYLQKVDVLIAGDSNIHLEAAQLNIYPLYYDFSSRQLDHYGFLAGGLLDKRHENPADLIETLDALSDPLPDVRKRARYYCATIDTRHDGRSTELAAGLIQDIARGNEIDLASWEPVENLAHLQAYRPK